MGGQAFAHLLYHFVPTDSNWAANTPSIPQRGQWTRAFNVTPNGARS